MKTELVFIPLPASSHLVSIVQLAKLLVGRDDEGLSIKILVLKHPFDAAANSYMQSLQAETTKGIQYLQLPDLDPEPARTDPVPKPHNPFVLMSKLLETQKPQVKNVVSKLKEESRLGGLVIDMFCTPMIDVANDLEIPTYVFYSSCASMIGLGHHLLGLIDDKCDIAQYKDSEFVELSVSTYASPVPAKLCPSSMLDLSTPILKHVKRLITESRGIMVNSFFELETYAIKALAGDQKMPAIYPVGPLISSNDIRNSSGDSDAILRWLDGQPKSSVIFFCFGSFGSFEVDQVKEIADAIERSGCRFLWSLRRPPPKERFGQPGEYENYEEVLPEGFSERTSGTGMVIGWAPQARVLAHPAVGGFVTHCGWNSVLESVWFGVPMAAWPMYAEQQMNAFLLVKGLGIAAEIKMDYKRDILGTGTQVIVRADEIEGGIRELMQPESEIRKKVEEMREKARTALVEGGSSYISLGGLIEDFHGSNEGSH